MVHIERALSMFSAGTFDGNVTVAHAAGQWLRA